MVFSSILFIFRFLPIAMFFYFLTPNRFKNLTLLLLSLIFYSWGEPKYFLIMLASIFVDYFVSIGIDKYKENKFKPLSDRVVSVSVSSPRTFIQFAAFMTTATSTMASASTVSAIRINRLRILRIISVPPIRPFPANSQRPAWL